MRVTTDLWVSALVRRAFAAGGFAAVLRKGAAEAGAIFVVTRGRMGEVSLYGPAAQTSYDERKPSERLFRRIEEVADADALDRRMERESRFDPDLWLVEIEAGDDFVAEAVPLTKEG
jgi:hypothetical protein